ITPPRIPPIGLKRRAADRFRCPVCVCPSASGAIGCITGTGSLIEVPHMRRKLLGLALLVGVGLISLSTARGWWITGHGTITEAAALALPDDMPAFFRAAAKSLAHLAGDPDRWKNRETPALNIAEYPHHFLDIEDLEGNEIPRDRFTAMAVMRKLNRAPDKVGL